MRDGDQEAMAELRQSTQTAISELKQTAAAHYNETTGALNALTVELRRHAEAVAVIQPQVAAMQLSRSKLAILASIGLLTLWIVGYLFKIKFGG